MATTKITDLTSIFSDTMNTPAFNGSTTSADTLTVDEGAYIVATALGSTAALLDPDGAWRVNVNGSIFSQHQYGIHLMAGNKSNSTITVGASGEVGSLNSSAIRMENDGTIKNAGMISGDAAIRFDGGTKHAIVNTGTIFTNNQNAGDSIVDSTITNSGAIGGTIKMANGNNNIKNTGRIENSIVAGVGNDTITNNGFIGGVITFGDGNNKYSAGTNSFVDDLVAGSGNDIVSIAGAAGNITLGDGSNSITILKTGSASSVVTGTGADKFTNSGTITSGNIDLGDGNDAFTNSGTMTTATIELGIGNNVFTNSGSINTSAAIGASDGNDKFTNSGTIVAPTITLNRGENVFTNSGNITATLQVGLGFSRTSSRTPAPSTATSISPMATTSSPTAARSMPR
ncbi:MAG: hypothetical protein IPK23_10090 [Rhizobiales bacterium]|nr:hypothetical protein [Hyphomicrobiales bacterium]